MKTTKHHFKIFKSRCKYWQAYFELSHYRITFVHVHIKDAYAQTTTDSGNLVATIEFSKHWDSRIKLSNKALDHVARHELCHIITAGLLGAAADRYTEIAELMRESEEIARRLDSIFDKMMTTNAA